MRSVLSLYEIKGDCISAHLRLSTNIERFLTWASAFRNKHALFAMKTSWAKQEVFDGRSSVRSRAVTEWCECASLAAWDASLLQPH